MMHPEAPPLVVSREGRETPPSAGRGSHVSLAAQFKSQKAELLRMAHPPHAGGGDDLLPAPVRRYLSTAGEQPALRAAVLTQRGALRTAPGKPWMTFTSEQIYSMQPPAFVWLARARAAPFMRIIAKDSFIAGAGNMNIRLFGLIPVANAYGAEIDQGAALRYWGEVLAFPGMVCHPQLQWQAIDDHRARFRVDAYPTVSAVAEFDRRGFLTATHAERYREIGGRKVLTPWSGYMRDWKIIDGCRFPGTWEAVWHLATGQFPAVRMEVLSIAPITGGS